jgi:hypothetical protein
MSTRIVAMSWALVLAGVWLMVAPSAVVAAPSDECPTINDFCLEEDLGDEDEPGNEPATPVVDHEGQGTTADGPICTWEQRGVAGPTAVGDGSPFTEVGGTPGAGAEFFAEVCDGVFTGRARWIGPAGPAAPPAMPAPEQLAEVVRVRLEGSLPAPEVVTTPEAGVAALVGYPSFVSVANWTGVVSDGECDPTGLLCVTVTATPSMQWSPGEPDAAPVKCSGPGVVFDPEGPHPDVQAAAPDACAHSFEMRTAVPGRPRQWPGVVTVEWSLTWSSSLGGSGSLTPVTKSADVPRDVNEVQSVVVSAGG